jgi:hypothetical protein
MSVELIVVAYALTFLLVVSLFQLWKLHQLWKELKKEEAKTT